MAEREWEKKLELRVGVGEWMNSVRVRSSSSRETSSSGRERRSWS